MCMGGDGSTVHSVEVFGIQVILWGGLVVGVKGAVQAPSMYV